MFGWLQSGAQTSIGFIRVTDEIIDQIRKRVEARTAILKIIVRSRSAAETEIEQAARFEIVAAYRDANPGRDYQVKRNWPLAQAMLNDEGMVMIRIWIGHDFEDGRNGIEPILVKVDWRLGGKSAAPKTKAK